MKIAYLFGSLNRGGTETLLLDVFSKMNDVPYSFIGLHRKGGTLLRAFHDSGVQMLRLSPHFPFDPLYLYRLRKLLMAGKVNVVHAQQCLDALYAKLAVCGKDIRVIQTFHGYDFNNSLYGSFILRLSLKVSDMNLFVSGEQQKYYTKKYKIPEEKQQVIYNGVSFEKLDGDLKGIPVFGERKGVRIGMVGNFVPGRAQNFVCEFLDLLNRASVDFQFVFIGKKSDSKPELYDNCVSFCREHGLESRVQFLGGREDVPFILKQLDAFVYASDHDTFGIAVVEAMVMGVPTFVNDWGVMSEITRQGKWATLYKTGDKEDLLEKFMLFLKDMKAWRIKAETNKNEVSEKFSIESHISALNEVYLNL